MIRSVWKQTGFAIILIFVMVIGSLQISLVQANTELTKSVQKNIQKPVLFESQPNQASWSDFETMMVMDGDEITGFHQSTDEMVQNWNEYPEREITQNTSFDSIHLEQEFVIGEEIKADGNGTISGTILDSDGQPITDTMNCVSVHALSFDSTGSSLGTCVSEIDGSYSITGLIPGSYRVIANNNQDNQYVTKYYTNTFVWEDADPVVVYADQTTANINFQLEEGGIIRGKVLKNDGNVITDVHLEVRANTNGYQFLRSAQVSQVDGSYEITGLPDGDYRVEANVYTLGYDRKFYDDVYRWDQATLVSITNGNIVENIDFNLGPGGGISGVVYASDGITPVENACINVSSTAPAWNQVVGWGSTGSDGSFSFGGVPTGDMYIYVDAKCGNNPTNYLNEWYAVGGSVLDGSQADVVQILEGQVTTGINFQLDEGSSISGRITDSVTGLPIVNAQVDVRFADVNEWAGVNGNNTNQDGIYTITGLPADNDYKIVVTAQGYLRTFYTNAARFEQATSVSVNAGQTTESINVSLIPADSHITGQVLYADNSPAVNIWMEAFHDDGWFVGVNANENGEYDLPVIGGDWHVFPYQPPYFADSQSLTVESGDTVTGINFTLQEGGNISGTVTDQDTGTGIANIMVKLAKASDGGWWWGCTNSDGDYQFQGHPLDDYKISALVDSRCNADLDYGLEYWQEKSTWDSADIVSITEANRDITGINFTLGPGGSISGIVTDAMTGLPIANATVHPLGSNFQWLGKSVQTDSSGRYEIKGLDSGNYFVVGNADGYGVLYYPQGYDDRNATGVTVTGGEETTGINFALSVEGIVRGKIVDAASGLPVVGASVYAFPRTGGQTFSDVTDSSGEYEIGSLSTGNFIVRVKADGYPEYYYENSIRWTTNMKNVRIDSGQITSGIDITIAQPGTISGTIYAPDGVTGIQNARVYISWIHDGNIETLYTTTNQDGAYQFLNIPPRVWTVYVEPYNATNDNGYMREFYAPSGDAFKFTDAVPVNLLSNQTVSDIDIVLNPGGEIHGTLLDENNQVITDTQLTVWADLKTDDYRDNGYGYSSVSQIDGSFVITGVEIGDFFVGLYPNSNNLGFQLYQNKIDIDSADYITLTQEEVITGINFNVPPGGSISGKITRTDTNLGVYRAIVSLSKLDGTPINSLTASTDMMGNYILTRIPVGQYLVHSYPNKGSNIDQVFYNQNGSVGNYTDATIITVTEGQTTQNINLQVNPAGLIEGFVYAQDGVTPLKGITVQIISVANPTIKHTTITDMMGNYCFPGVPFGRYWVYANTVPDPDYVSRYYNNESVRADAVQLNITRHAWFEEINFSLKETVKETVTPETGGEIVVENEETSTTTTVTIPPAAVTEEIELVFAPMESVDQEAGFQFGGSGFDLDAYIGDEVVEDFQFSQPVTVSFTYRDEDLHGLAEDELYLYYWNEDLELWEDGACGDYVRDFDHNIVSTQICHLSRYALMIENWPLYLPLIIR